MVLNDKKFVCAFVFFTDNSLSTYADVAIMISSIRPIYVTWYDIGVKTP